MPTAFTAEDKTRITAALLDAGEDLFARQGLKKTSLDELAAPAGIAKSSFYLFYDSKESLYLAVMLRQAAQVKRRVIDEGLRTADDPSEALRRFLRAALTELATNPLWRRLTSHPEEMTAVVRRLDLTEAMSTPDNPAVALRHYVTEHGSDFVEADPAVIIGVLQTVLLVPVNADRIGPPEHVDRVLDLLIDLVATGLTRRPPRE